jgi:hypothetical protein
MITLHLEEIKVKPDEIYNPDSYEGDGIYIAITGTSNSIVTVIDGLVGSIPLPNEIIMDKYMQDKVEEVKEDLLGTINSKLDNLLKYVGTKEVNASTNTSLDLDDITRLVAVAQKPELIKE